VQQSCRQVAALWRILRSKWAIRTQYRSAIRLKAFYADHFVLPLPEGHRFPMVKYSQLRARVGAELPTVQLCEPAAATDGQIALAHHPEYLEQLVHGRLSAQAQRVLGFPWSLAMVERSRRSTGATIEACRAALIDGASANLAGGTHHAYADRGEGFCCLNDMAVAARLIQAETQQAETLKNSRPIKRVMIIDLDVHQGNGTAAILKNDPSVFTLSVHGQSNYPFRKESSSLDIGLPDGTSDDVYLSTVQDALRISLEQFSPDFILYLAGADVYEGDRLGRLKISMDGCRQRDQLVIDFARRLGLPIAAAMGGGYCPKIEETVAVHFNTIAALAAYANN
jgi:acetoin utilization deacetylase AcuC-like enzyme